MLTDVTGNGFDGINLGSSLCVEDLASNRLSPHLEMTGDQSRFFAKSGPGLFRKSSFGFSLWFRERTIGTSLTGLAVVNAGFNAQQIFKLEKVKSQNTLDLTITGFGVISSRAKNMPLDEWHHVVVNYDAKKAAKKIQFFIDGELVSSHAGPAEITTPTTQATLLFGLNNSFSPDYSLDEIRFYKRALSSEDVKELYSQGLTFKGTALSLGTKAVLCKNLTTGQEVALPESTSSTWDCYRALQEANPGSVLPGDELSVTISGKFK